MAEYLHLRREYWRLRAGCSRTEADQAAQAEAEADQAEFQRDQEAFERAPRPATLDADQQQELKRLYREAVMRCHPDRVTEADRAAARAIFVQVQQAYQQGNLDTLNRLHRHLTEGQTFADPAQGVDRAGSGAGADRLGCGLESSGAWRRFAPCGPVRRIRPWRHSRIGQRISLRCVSGWSRNARSCGRK